MGDLGVLNVKMEGDNEVLDEVVVVGAGTQKKVSITGAITATEGIQLKAPTSSLTSSLAGKLAGVISTNIRTFVLHKQMRKAVQHLSVRNSEPLKEQLVGTEDR